MHRLLTFFGEAGIVVVILGVYACFFALLFWALFFVIRNAVAAGIIRANDKMISAGKPKDSAQAIMGTVQDTLESDEPPSGWKGIGDESL